MALQRYSTSANDTAPLLTTGRHTRFLMEALAMTVDGPVDRRGGAIDPRLANCLLLHQARLLIGGTACSRPLMLDEASLACASSGYDTILVRPDREHHATFDVLPYETLVWSCGYRLWMEQATHGPWLVPLDGSGEAFRLGPTGMDVRPNWPGQGNAFLERRGYAHGRQILSIATQGWF